MKKQILGLAVNLTAGLALGAASLGAFAQAKPEVQVEQRQAVMALQAKYFYSIVPMAQGRIPMDSATITRNVGYLDVLSKMAWDNFPAGTADVKGTKALPAVFSDPAKFKAAQDNFQAELTKLDAAVKSGNEAAIKTAILDTNTKGCNGCHTDFRARNN